jgi:hypothetical protein
MPKDPNKKTVARGAALKCKKCKKTFAYKCTYKGHMNKKLPCDPKSVRMREKSATVARSAAAALAYQRKKAGFTLVELQEMFSPEARVKYDKLIRLLFIPLKETDHVCGKNSCVC